MKSSSLGRIASVALVAIATAAIAATAFADDLPAVTQKYLQDLNLSEDVMNGVDQDLAIPQEWMDGAVKEGTVKVIGTWHQKDFGVMNAPFTERYPKIKVIYTEAMEMNSRAATQLVAFKQGQYLSDVITGFGGAVPEYKQAKALENITDLPGFRNQVDGANDPDGTWAAMRLRYWCIAYNTKLVKKEDLPKTWDDLLTSTVLNNGNLGIGNRPQLWLQMLMTENGKAWTEDYTKKFFTQLKPQFRNESLDALVAILAAGEVRAMLPVAEFKAKMFEEKGAPVSWHCPEPVPLAPSQMGIMAGNPHPNAARVWTNWMLSREAQLAQFVADHSPPSHKALQRKEFVVYADEVVGRHLVQADEQYNRAVYAIWQQYWVK